MENPTILSSNGRRSSASNSPEFEFWMLRNPSSQQPTLHSADELFSGGILLPLQLLNAQNSDDPPDKEQIPEEPTYKPSINPNPDSIQGSDLKTNLSSSKRWKDIFKKNPENKEEKKKKERNNGGGSGVSAGGGGGTSTAELNIYLWPFSRSRSAGNSGSRPRTVVGNRKINSAPCSRSNSTGDKYRRWPSSPGRVGVHLGRNSPVWQVKRLGQSRSLHDNVVRTTAEKVSRPVKKSAAGDAGENRKVLNVNVPTCIGYRQRMSCRSDVVKESGSGRNAGVAPGIAAGEGGASSLFNLRSLFTKKVF